MVYEPPPHSEQFLEANREREDADAERRAMLERDDEGIAEPRRRSLAARLRRLLRPGQGSPPSPPPAA